MKVRLVDSGWSQEFAKATRQKVRELRIICPFIKMGALERLLTGHLRSIQVITRYIIC